MSDSDRDTIIKGLEEIEIQIEAGQFVWRTDREDVHMNIEAALTDLVGEPAKKLHTARSRNDQVATDFRLWCRDAIDTTISRIKNLQVICSLFRVRIIGGVQPEHYKFNTIDTFFLYMVNKHEFIVSNEFSYYGKNCEVRAKLINLFDA